MNLTINKRKKNDNNVIIDLSQEVQKGVGRSKNLFTPTPFLYEINNLYKK